MVILGSGGLAQAIARRVGNGMHIICADLHLANAEKASMTLRDAGFDCSTAQVNVTDRQSLTALAQRAVEMGEVKYVVNSAGVSPSQAPVDVILKVDLYGTALFLEIFGSVIAEGGCGIVIGSQSGHRLPALTAEQDRQLATTPSEALLALPFVQVINDTLLAYQVSKRGNSLRVQEEAVRWAERGARVNCISPGIIHTPLANDELNGERKDFYRNMLANQPAKRGGTPDEVAALAALIMGPEGGYITGSDFLIDGGATAKFFYGN